MGASEWHAKTAYQDDIGAALAQARQEAYDRGDFYRSDYRNVEALRMDQGEYVAWAIAQTIATVPPELADLDWDDEEHREEWKAARVTVTGPDSLLASQLHAGAHSVIDMTRVAEVPSYNAVAPAPDDYLLRFFGTTKPQVADIDAAIDTRRLDSFGHWPNMYLIGYEDARPKAVYFFGSSGG
jgi:hypothetical protein